MEKKTIGSFISALRRAAGMTQRDLAEQLNVSDKAVSRWERDESAPDLTLLPVIADLFGITVDELLRGQRRPAAEAAPQAQTEDAGEEGDAPSPISTPSQTNSKRQKMLFGNRLRKLKMLNYISLGLFAAGVIAALLCNFAFYRAALGFFLGLLFEVAAVICAVAFGSAAMPVSEEEYDAALLEGYKRDVIRVTHLPIYLAALTTPLLLFLLATWAEWGAYVGLSYSALLLLVLVSIFCALVLYEISTFVILPRVRRRFNVDETEREGQRRTYVGRLAKKVAIVTACAMILPVIAVGILTCGMLDPYTIFAKGQTFDTVEAFTAYMASEGKYGTTDDWEEYDFDRGVSYYAGNNIALGDGESLVFAEEMTGSAPPDQDIIEKIESGYENAEKTYNPQHRTIEDVDGNVIFSFDWINADVASIEWSFDQSDDGMPVTVYTVDDVRQSHAIYDVIVTALGILIVAISVCGVITYVVKRNRV
ncbi:MAG: helix-turn-helix transcriptional regulator [Clostridia bacterium]|nr:helix-turn-helix transcriptional regulator [Clostridia bacterium]